MKTFNEWKESPLEDNPKDQSLGHSELMEKFNEYIKTGLKKSDEPRREKQKRQPLNESDEWNKGHTSSTKDDSSVTLLSHRDSLRNDTAYPVLRMVNLLNSACIVLISFLWGTQIGDGAVAISVIIGVVVAILSYSISSVFFDVADSNINTSKNSNRS